MAIVTVVVWGCMLVFLGTLHTVVWSRRRAQQAARAERAGDCLTITTTRADMEAAPWN